MTRGNVFRRCGKCLKRVPPGSRRCPCGHDRFTWAFVVDLEPAGSPKRRQSRRGGFASKEAAQEALAKLKESRADGSYVEPTRQTLSQYLEGWLDRLSTTGEVRENTLNEWSGHVGNHITPRLGSVRLQALDLRAIRRFYLELRADGNRRGGGPLSQKSVWNVHLALHRALADAVRDRLIAVNPARGGMARPKDRPEIAFWTGAQLEEFLCWVDDEDQPHDQALYRLAAQTGMRRGELLGLRWMDLDLDRGQVIITQQMTRSRQLATLKTRASRRTLDLSPLVIAALRRHHDAQAFQRRAWGDSYEDLGLVFCLENGEAHQPDTVSKRFGRHVRAAKAKRIRFHDLRHTSAVIGLRELGEWPDETSHRLGHTSVAFTLDTYGHLVPHRSRQVADAFDRVLRGADSADSTTGRDLLVTER